MEQLNDNYANSSFQLKTTVLVQKLSVNVTKTWLIVSTNTNTRKECLVQCTVIGLDS